LKTSEVTTDLGVHWWAILSATDSVHFANIELKPFHLWTFLGKPGQLFWFEMLIPAVELDAKSAQTWWDELLNSEMPTDETNIKASQTGKPDPGHFLSIVWHKGIIRTCGMKCCSIAAVNA